MSTHQPPKKRHFCGAGLCLSSSNSWCCCRRNFSNIRSCCLIESNTTGMMSIKHHQTMLIHDDSWSNKPHGLSPKLLDASIFPWYSQVGKSSLWLRSRLASFSRKSSSCSSCCNWGTAGRRWQWLTPMQGWGWHPKSPSKKKTKHSKLIENTSKIKVSSQSVNDLNLIWNHHIDLWIWCADGA